MMNFSKGKGNNALKSIAEKKMQDNSTKVVMIPIDKIEYNPINSFYNMDKVDSIAHDIKENGLLDVIVVVRKDDKYEVLSGHTRLQAVKKLGWTEVACKIEEVKDEFDKINKMLSYNNQREKNLKDFAGEVKAWSEAKKRDGFKGDMLNELCRKFDKSRSVIQRFLAFSKLTPELQDKFNDKVIVVRALTSTAKLDTETQNKINAAAEFWLKEKQEETIPESVFAEIVNKITGKTVEPKEKLENTVQTEQEQQEQVSETPQLVEPQTQEKIQSKETTADKNAEAKKVDNVSSSAISKSNEVTEIKSKPDARYNEWYELVNEVKAFISRQNDYGTFSKMVLGDINSLRMCLEDEELRIKNDM